MASLEVGKVQIYTGDGKGKTTAALGLAMRAKGYGSTYSCCSLPRSCTAPSTTPRRAGTAHCTGRSRHTRGLRRADHGARTRADITGRRSDFGRTRRSDAPRIRDARGCGGADRAEPATTELVLTGRGLLPLADLADLVTEMRPVKHYFDEGLLARQGIEY